MKRKRPLMLIGSVCLILVLAALLLPACAKEAPEAPAQETFHWKYQGAYGPGDHEVEYGIRSFIDFIEEQSDGRLTMDMFYDGEIFAGDEFLESLGKGLTEIANGDPNYFSGIEPAADVWGGPPYGNLPTPNYGDVYALHTVSKLSKLWREFYDQHNIRLIGSHPYGLYPCMASKVPIRSNADFQGLKVRAGAACFASFLEELGASTVWIPGTDQYEALLLGTIDVATYTFEAVEDMNWCEVMDYLIVGTPETPAWLVNIGTTAVNKDSWETLPTDLKDIIEAAERRYARENTEWYIQCFNRVVGDMAEEWGYEVIWLSEADIEEQKQIAYDVIWPAMAKQSPLAAEAIELMKEWYGMD